MAILRVSGPVVSVDTRTGRKGDYDWTMRVARILHQNLDFVEVLLSDNQPMPGAGEWVDWMVDCAVRGGYLNVSYRCDTPPAPSVK